ncbi:hypothetical protein L1887_35426 [Cichorium endivia]|nr:hypothetical protein L1887_35426 [Cichorium endivia]
MDALQTMYDTPLPDCIKKEVTIVSGKLDNILARLPVTLSDPTGVPGGGKADEKLETIQVTNMVLDNTAGPSGTKDPENIQLGESITDKGGEDENQNKESEDDHLPINPPQISPPPISPPPINPPQKSPPPISPPPINPPQKSPPPISPPPINPSPIPSP